MDSFEFNKIAGAVLATGLVVLGLKNLTGIIYHTAAPEKPGFMIEVAEASGTAEAPAATGPAVSIGKLLATADATKGAATAKACMACHDFTKGGPNKTGPNLWDVVERPIASHEGFTYSDGIKTHSGDKDGLCRPEEGSDPRRSHCLSRIAFRCAQAVSGPIKAAIIAKNWHRLGICRCFLLGLSMRIYSSESNLEISLQ